jgi:hypothetical protein
LNSGRFISTNPEPRVVAKTATGGNGGKKILDDRFWVNFRQEDRICRKEVKKKLKPETGGRKGSGE